MKSCKMKSCKMKSCKMIYKIVLCLLLLFSTFAYAQPISDNTVTIRRAGIRKFDYTSGDLDYMGENVNADAADGDADWIIYKFTWSGGEVTVIQRKEGSWTGRASLF